VLFCVSRVEVFSDIATSAETIVPVACVQGIICLVLLKFCMPQF